MNKITKFLWPHIGHCREKRATLSKFEKIEWNFGGNIQFLIKKSLTVPFPWVSFEKNYKQSFEKKYTLSIYSWCCVTTRPSINKQNMTCDCITSYLNEVFNILLSLSLFLPTSANMYSCIPSFQWNMRRTSISTIIIAILGIIFLRYTHPYLIYHKKLIKELWRGFWICYST